MKDASLGFTARTLEAHRETRATIGLDNDDLARVMQVCGDSAWFCITYEGVRQVGDGRGSWAEGATWGEACARLLALEAVRRVAHSPAQGIKVAGIAWFVFWIAVVAGAAAMLARGH